MNSTLLRQVYRIHRIKKKKYRWYKVAKNMDEAAIRQDLGRMKRQLTMAKNDGYRFVYLDETMVTRKTVPDTEWARPKENVQLDLAQLDEPTLALLASISTEKGLEHYQIFHRSVDKKKFEEWLRGLKESSGADKVCLFMDNLSAHTCEDSKKVMRELGFRWVFNVAYSPQWNPIELTFSKFKHNFKLLRAQKMVGVRQESHKVLVEKAWKTIRKQDVVNSIRHVNDLLK